MVAFCDRHCNVIAPFVAAPGNHNESPLLREALPEVMRIVREVGMDPKAPSSVLMASTTVGQPQGDLQSPHGSQHQPQSARQKAAQARP